MEINAKWFTVVKCYLVNPFAKGKCLDEEHVYSLCECSLNKTDVMQQ